MSSLEASLMEDFDASESEDDKNLKQESETFMDINENINSEINTKNELVHNEELNKLIEQVEIMEDDGKKANDLVMKCSQYVVDIEDEIRKIYTSLVFLYSKRFNELASHVAEPVPYAKCVKLIQNEHSVSSMDFSAILQPAQAMAISMTGSKLDIQLSPEDLNNALHFADSILKLADMREDILLPFIATQMSLIAPNVNAILGSDVAAQLLAVVGGLEALVTIPSCNLATIGHKTETLHGFSSKKHVRHFGIVHGCSLVQECLPEHQKKAMRVVSGRVALAARMDFDGKDKSGESGRSWRLEIRNKLEHWHKPPPGKTQKALPVPQTESKKKRGGKRARRLKELYGLSEVQKEANRVQFGSTNDEYGDSAMGKTQGRLGQSGTGKLRITEKERRKMAKHHVDDTPVNRRVLLNDELGASTSSHVSFNVIASSNDQTIELRANNGKKDANTKSQSKYFGKLSFAKSENNE